MGFFDAAKAAYNGNRAYHLHVDANKLAGEGKVAQAKEKYQAALKLYDEAVRQGNNGGDEQEKGPVRRGMGAAAVAVFHLPVACG